MGTRQHTNETNGNVLVITKKLIGHVDNSADPAITVISSSNFQLPPTRKRLFPS